MAPRKQRRKGWWRLIAWTATRVVLALLLSLYGLATWSTTRMQAALYNKSAGDFFGDYLLAVCATIAAVLLLVYGLVRFLRLFHIARHGEKIGPLTLQGSKAWRMRLYDYTDGSAVEWLLLKYPRKLWREQLTGHVSEPREPVVIRGRHEIGNWFVIQTYDNRLLWPATRSQLVIGTGARSIPSFSNANYEFVIALHRLLAVYAQILDQLNGLPLVIRYPLDNVTPSWWWLGVPRFIVVRLVSGHIRRSLGALYNAHVRRALLTDTGDGGTLRNALYKASQECQVLAATLPQSTFLTLLASFITLGLPVYATFFVAPHIAVTHKFLLEFYLLWAVAGYAPLMMLYRSARCKHVLFASTTFCQTRIDNGNVQISSSYNAYKYEEDAFRLCNEKPPRELGGQPRVFWLLAGIYGLTVVSSILIVGGLLHGALLFMAIFGAVVGRIVLDEGMRAFTSRLKKLYAQLIKIIC